MIFTFSVIFSSPGTTILLPSARRYQSHESNRYFWEAEHYKVSPLKLTTSLKLVILFFFSATNHPQKPILPALTSMQKQPFALLIYFSFFKTKNTL
jgi:hypothetical protein